MEKAINTRTRKQRLKFSCLFELTLIAIMAPMGAFVLEKEILDVGVLAIGLSLKAMLFNLLYNWMFDRYDVRAGRIPTQRNVPRRILHAVGFEVGLVITSLPIVVWWLGLSILQALIMDLVVSSFVVVYTFVFTWSYDRLYPVEQCR